jgi:uncharacterized protein (TIGR02145 family)
MKKYLPLFLIVLIITLCLQIGCDKDEPIMSGLPVIIPPTQITPANSAIIYSDSVTFTWRKVIGVTGYTLQVALDSNFSSIIFNQSGLTDTSKKIYNLEYRRIYFWRVNSVLYNTVTPWSTVSKFTTSEIMKIPCPGTPTVSYAGKMYNTVQIGNQCWLKENLDVGIMIQGTDTAKNNGIIEKYCYNNDTNNCVIHGGLYQWDEAMQYTSTEGVRGICPSGWHLPTELEFETLIKTVGHDANSLKAIGQGTHYGAGTNTSGFTALLSGCRTNYGHFYNIDYITNFWSSTEDNTDLVYEPVLYTDYSYIYSLHYAKDYAYSVRCLKD